MLCDQTIGIRMLIIHKISVICKLNTPMPLLVEVSINLDKNNRKMNQARIMVDDEPKKSNQPLTANILHMVRICVFV